ncbi:DUF3459 domain-containing protein [Streptomyces sp.]|uniref:DUF3459 domain-containing protein n=1 Tax=Streptomyces sp. TaxID=1931 RepID=UPI0039C9F7FC
MPRNGKARAALSEIPSRRLPAAPGVLASSRGGGLICAVNLAWDPAELPGHTSVLLTSGPLDDEGRLPRDTAAWLRA